MLEQNFNNENVALLSSHMQRRVVQLRLGVNIGTVAQQEVDHVDLGEVAGRV